MHMQMTSLPGKVLVGVDKKTHKPCAIAARFAAKTPQGTVRGWLVEKDGKLEGTERTWDDCATKFKKMGLALRIEDSKVTAKAEVGAS